MSDIYSKKFVTLFEPLKRKFSINNGYCLALASNLAYEKEKKIKQVALENWKFKACEFFDNNGSQAFIAHDDEKIVVSFRGTQTEEIADLFADLNVFHSPGPAGLVHSGFKQGLAEIWQPMSEHIHALRFERSVDLGYRREKGLKVVAGEANQGVRSIFFTGHSLGGALATLAAAEMKLRDSERPVAGLYTFGQPRVGNEEFVDAFNRAMGPRAYRVVNNNDLVTRVAPRAMGYGHIGAVRYLDTNKVLHKDIAWWDMFLDRVNGRLEDFLEVFTEHDLMPDGIEDHSMTNGYIPGMKNNL